jgi:peptidyl-tRNA hydrolase
VGQILITYFKIEQRKPHTFPAQLINFNKTFSEAVPQLVVMQHIVFVKQIKAVNTSGLQIIGMKEFFERLAAIGFEIP